MEPKKEHRVQVVTTLTPAVGRALYALAEREERSVAYVIRRAIEHEVETPTEKEAP